VQVAVLHGYVPNEGDAWRYTLDSLSRFFAAALTRPGQNPTEPVHPRCPNRRAAAGTKRTLQQARPAGISSFASCSGCLFSAP